MKILESNINKNAYMLSIFMIGNVRGGSRISGKGVHMCKGMGVRVPDFISFF